MNAIVNPLTNSLSEENLEKASSAITLADMEIFIFPELLYSLLLANIMSPIIWKWRADPWFDGIEKMTPYRRVLRLKQFIMDRYEFNLDLETWGLTTKDKELARFKNIVTEETLSRSNALFGYEGDKYYFDIDIRRHFGLDKYTSDIIPYWKTETVEAMDAFQYRDGFKFGGGECVSLSTLYAAALFIVCRIPLDDIFLLATPLHSQNFVDAREGILTNNRRILTKNMCFNGTELSAKAQRALRNEQITIVSHHTGHIHVAYPEATIEPEAYERLKLKLDQFLVTEVNAEIVANFLRQESHLQVCFQLMIESRGKARYIPAERVYAYEHNSPYRVSNETRDKLLADIDEDEFYTEPIAERVLMNSFEDFFKQIKIDLSNPEDLERLRSQFTCNNSRSEDILESLISFCRIQPRYPDQDVKKTFTKTEPLAITPDMDREAIIARLESIRSVHAVADLAFFAYRDLARTDWEPFLKAAMERNPVCVEETKAKSDEAVVQALSTLPNESIYDGSRLAQPDEVWAFGRGDGVERALCLTAIWQTRHPELPVRLNIQPDNVLWEAGDLRLEWPSDKGLEKEIEWPIPG